MYPQRDAEIARRSFSFIIPWKLQIFFFADYDSQQRAPKCLLRDLRAALPAKRASCSVTDVGMYVRATPAGHIGRWVCNPRLVRNRWADRQLTAGRGHTAHLFFFID